MTKKVFYGYGGQKPLTEEELLAEYEQLGITPKPVSANRAETGSTVAADTKVSTHQGNPSH